MSAKYSWHSPHLRVMMFPKFIIHQDSTEESVLKLFLRSCGVVFPYIEDEIATRFTQKLGIKDKYKKFALFSGFL